MPHLTPYSQFLKDESVNLSVPRRLLRPIGDVPPDEFEMMYHQQTESSNVA
jgi:hypothetical protein